MQVGKFNRIDPAPKQELEAFVRSASPNDGFDFSASGYSKPGINDENYNTHQQTTIGSILEQESMSNLLKTRNRLNITKKETMKTRPPG